MTDADLSAALDIAWRLCGDFDGERDEWPRLQRSGAFVEQHAPRGGGTWAVYEVDPDEVLLWDAGAEWEHPRERIGEALVAALETLGRGETLPGEMVWDSSDYLVQRCRRAKLRAAPEEVARRAARLAGVSRRALLWSRVTDETWEKVRELVDGEGGAS